MPLSESYSYLWGPLGALGVIGLLTLLLRWAFGHGGSLVARPARSGAPEEYGLLVAVAAPNTFVEAEMMRRTLDDAGLRATVTTTTAGPRLMVFAADEKKARTLLARR